MFCNNHTSIHTQLRAGPRTTLYLMRIRSRAALDRLACVCALNGWWQEVTQSVR